jgi:hypothetical protein
MIVIGCPSIELPITCPCCPFSIDNLPCYPTWLIPSDELGFAMLAYIAFVVMGSIAPSC